MSICEVDDEAYNRILFDGLQHYLKRGFTLEAAKRAAVAETARCFTRISNALQTETQGDYNDERRSDWTR